MLVLYYEYRTLFDLRFPLQKAIYLKMTKKIKNNGCLLRISQPLFDVHCNDLLYYFIVIS